MELKDAQKSLIATDACATKYHPPSYLTCNDDVHPDLAVKLIDEVIKSSRRNFIGHISVEPFKLVDTDKDM